MLRISKCTFKGEMIIDFRSLDFLLLKLKIKLVKLPFGLEQLYIHFTDSRDHFLIIAFLQNIIF